MSSIPAEPGYTNRHDAPANEEKYTDIFFGQTFPSELSDGYDIDEVTRVFRQGWEATCRRFPILAGEAVIDTEGKQLNLMKLQSMTDEDRLQNVQPITVNDLRESGAFHSTFAELKARQFPVSDFNSDLLTRHPRVWAFPGDRLPIMKIQLNFLQGGLLLNWSPFHMVGDGMTFGLHLDSGLGRRVSSCSGC